MRQATPDDHDALSLICLRTGAAGEDATAREDDPSLLGLIYAVPYQIYAPDFAFVVDAAGVPSGYLLAALDTAAFNRQLAAEWYPPLQRRIPPPPADKSRWVGSDWARDLIHHPRLETPAPLAAFPSHIHIDLLPNLRGKGVGRRIMAVLEARLAAAGSSGLHLGVDPRNTRAIGFYGALGFAPIQVPDAGRGTLFMGKRLIPQRGSEA